MLYKVTLSFESVDEILKCDHSNESSMLSSTFLWYCLLCRTRCVAVYNAAQGDSNFDLLVEILKWNF